MARFRAFESLRRGDRVAQADGRLDLYTDDVMMVGYHKSSPPFSPMKLERKETIEPIVRDICGREVTQESAMT